MGGNGFGELGEGSFTNNPHIQEIVASNVTAISSCQGSPGAGDFTLFLKSDGSVWGMGNNNQGGFLTGGTFLDHAWFPQQIISNGVTAIAAGQNHFLFLKPNGSLWAVGYNYYGQLGDGTFNDTPTPEMIVASNVTAIAAGLYHSLFLKSDGSLWGMGDSGNGQLGLRGSNRYVSFPEMIVASNVTTIAAGSSSSVFLESDGSLWGMFNPINPPQMIVASNVTVIAAGAGSRLFLKNDGSLWAFGSNGYGQLGDGTTSNAIAPEQIVASNVTAIAAGLFHSLFLKSDGSLWGMGGNGYGQMGDGTYNDTYSPKQLTISFLPGYNRITSQSLIGGNLQLSFVGIATNNYALDRSFSLSPPNWIPQATNPAGSLGALVFTNTPNPTTNNFWRIRSVP
jgi:alpha-tubulin suppressor-like RCC1 family protein